MAKQPTKKKGRKRKTLSDEEKHARRVKRARKKVQKAVTAHLPAGSMDLWKALADAPDFDVATLWRLAIVEIAQLSEELEDAKKRNSPGKRIDMYRRRMAGYLEMARRLAIAAKEIQPEPVSELLVDHQGLALGNIWVDEDGEFIAPEEPEEPEA